MRKLNLSGKGMGNEKKHQLQLREKFPYFPFSIFPEFHGKRRM
jgi:hypothetical protein